MKQDSRGLLAITVSILVFLIWYSVIVPRFWPQEEKAKEEVKKERNIPQSAAAQGGVAQEVGEKSQAEQSNLDVQASSEQNVEEVLSTIKTDNFIVTFSNYGAVPVNWELKDYKATVDEKNVPVNLVPEKRLSQMPLALSFLKTSEVIPETPKYMLVEKGDRVLRYQWSSGKTVIEKIYTLGENEYDINLKILVKNLGDKSSVQQIALGWSAALPLNKKSGGFLSFLKRPSDQKMPVYMINGDVERERSPGGIEEVEFSSGMVYWAGIEDRYFLSAIVPRSEGELGIKLERFGTGADAGFYSGVVMPEETVAPGTTQEYNFSVYAGPKEMQTLKAMGMNLDKAIDYGWFTVIAIPILYVLKFLYSVVHNYGIAIILLTILIKILLYPISKRAMKSMKGMKDIQPQLKAIKEKYKDDKERLNLEMMQLFKRHKVNPMSGCLPMILQFPVYIALYRVLWNSIELYHAPFFWIYKDLSQPDPYYITPVLLGVAMFLQQKLTPSATADPAQQKMMMIMPVMFTVFLAFLPVGLVVYILVNTLLTVLQQWMNNNDIRFRDLIRGKLPKRANA